MQMEYENLLTDLHPNSVLVLVIFHYLCKTFISIHPSMVLFCHFYYPRVEDGTMSRSVMFRLRDHLSSHYIIVDKKKHEEWHHR
jgi:hypothetical protein